MLMLFISTECTHCLIWRVVWFRSCSMLFLMPFPAFSTLYGFSSSRSSFAICTWFDFLFISTCIFVLQTQPYTIGTILSVPGVAASTDPAADIDINNSSQIASEVADLSMGSRKRPHHNCKLLLKAIFLFCFKPTPTPSTCGSLHHHGCLPNS